jgi:hypothetical protein
MLFPPAFDGSTGRDKQKTIIEEKEIQRMNEEFAKKTMLKEKKTTLSTSLSSSDLRGMVAAASTIPERLNGNFLADETPASEELRQQRFDVWCRIVTAGNREHFREVLSWDGYDIAEVRQILGHVQLREHVPLPA